ncbi:hypothetical protein Pcinc_008965 [Petrolisthes cinctipes]|uniref:Uncharacterized protein n=1 Tax=Petrolisthes cinctipes TaxID=88211 RepID=A0AAE1G7W0_PETCI|nr:hypothetical protein Pcinc_008965 [Petrolisthes cinctipes]
MFGRDMERKPSQSDLPFPHDIYTKIKEYRVVVVVVVVVMVVMLVVVAGSQTSPRFVLLRNLAPEGPIAVERKVGSRIECGAVCSAVSCEGFTYQSDHSVCTTYKAVTTLTHTHSKTHQLYCSQHRGGLVLKPDDQAHNTIDYFECRQPTIGKTFTLGISTNVDTGAGTNENESQLCPTDNIITGFSSNQRWINPDNLEAECQVMNNHVLDGAKCEDVVVSEGPWEGQDHEHQHSWNNIMYCPPGYLAVQLVRVWEEDTNNNRIKSLRCCQVMSK